MNGYEFSIVWHSVWRLLVMESQGRKTWWPGFPIGHHLRPLACQVLSPTSCQKVTLALEDISADYAGYEGRSEMQGKVRYGTTLDFLDRVLHVFAYGDSWHFRGNELRTVQAGGCMPPVQ